MKKPIAVEGLKKEIVSLICEMLERHGYAICYRHESPYGRTYDRFTAFDLLEEPSDIVKDILNSQPDLTILCNARAYFPLLEYYSKTTDIPLLVLTGGGPDLIEEVKRYTPHVLGVPFRMQDLRNKIEAILG